MIIIINIIIIIIYLLLSLLLLLGPCRDIMIRRFEAYGIGKYISLSLTQTYTHIYIYIYVKYIYVHAYNTHALIIFLLNNNLSIKYIYNIYIKIIISARRKSL